MGKPIKVTFWLFGSSLACVAVHNAIYGIWKLEEPYLFIAGLVLFVAFTIATIWNSITYIRFRKPEDLWKIGFIGFFGFLGLIPSIGPEFFIFFILLPLLFLKKKKIVLNK